MHTPKLALITGAARRIGRALAQALHQAGFNIAIHYFNSVQAAKTLEQELNAIRPNSARRFQADLSQTTSTISTELINEINLWDPKLTVVINNASQFIDDTHSLEAWDELFKCNVKSPYLLSLAAYPLLKKNQGSIINITDIHASIPLQHYNVYCMTKAALVLQTRSLAKQFAPKVRVNSIAPGAILWPEQHNALDQSSKEKIIKSTPLRSLGGTDPIVQAALYLINNTFITGTQLTVDGGLSC